MTTLTSRRHSPADQRREERQRIQRALDLYRLMAPKDREDFKLLVREFDLAHQSGTESDEAGA